MYISSTGNVNFNSCVNNSVIDDSKQKNLSQDFLDYVDPQIRKEYNKKTNDFLCPNALNSINSRFRYAQPGKKLEFYNKLSDFEIDIVNAIDAAFDKLPPLTEDRTFYRAVAGRDLPDEILNAQQGDTIIPDNGYSQVGLSEYYAQKYLPNEQYNPVLFEMKCPKGSKVSLSKHTGTGAEEGMLPRNTKFKILSKEKVNCPIVYADYYTGSPVSEDRFVTKYVLEYLIPEQNNTSDNINSDNSEQNSICNNSTEIKNTLPSFYTVYPNISSGKVNIKKYSPLDIELLNKISKLNNQQKNSLNKFLETI